jgi:hypothetical protein
MGYRVDFVALERFMRNLFFPTRRSEIQIQLEELMPKLVEFLGQVEVLKNRLENVQNSEDVSSLLGDFFRIITPWHYNGKFLKLASMIEGVHGSPKMDITGVHLYKIKSLSEDVAQTEIYNIVRGPDGSRERFMWARISQLILSLQFLTRP